MQSVAIQIKVAYETSGMTPEEIAEDQGFELAAVKAVLMQHSSKYRKACGKETVEEDTLNFSDDELRSVNESIMQIALTGENEAVRLKAATYVRDDKKGRKEVVKGVGHTQFNILSFNQSMAEAREAASKITSKFVPKTINV